MAFFKTLSRKPKEMKEEPPPVVDKEPEVEHEPTSVGVRRSYGSMSVSRSGRFKSKNRQRKTILAALDPEKSEGSDQKHDASNKSSAPQQTTTSGHVTTAATSSAANKNPAQQTTGNVDVTAKPTSSE